jgi:putative phage-type endonuclease
MFQWEDEAEWLEQRKKGIGGSEASMVLGINPWKSRLELWNEKVTHKSNIDATKQLMFKIGHILEPIIAEEYTKETGRILEERPLKIHHKYPFVLGNVDREIIGDIKGPGILEIKTKGAWTNWHEDDIPIYYYAQIQHYLNIYNYSWGSFAVLDLGVMKLNIVDIKRDDDFISKLVTEEIEFWKLVENKIPPPVSPTNACQEFLREKYKISEDITIDLKDNKEAEKWAETLKEAKRNIKTFDIMETEAKNHLMSIVGSAEKAVGNMYSISWKAPKDKEVFDLERFKIEFPELSKQYIKTEPQTRRFTVRFIEDKQTKSRKKDRKDVNVSEKGLAVIRGILNEEL